MPNQQFTIVTCDLLHILQKAYQFAEDTGDPWVREMCDSLFSCLMSRDLRKPVASIPREPHLKHFQILRDLVGE